MPIRKIRNYWTFCVATLLVGGAYSSTVAKRDAATTYIYAEAPRYEPRAWMEGRDRFSAGVRLQLASGKSRRPIAPGFYASADAFISYDATRLLFAGKRNKADRWSIWEVELNATATPRQIAQCPADCLRPLYLPDGRIVYSRGTDLAIAGEGPITFAPGRFLTSDVLRDGRILYESAGELFTVYPDGTGVESLRCDHGKARSDARQTSAGDYIFRSEERLARITSALAKQTDVAQPKTATLGPIAEIEPGEWLVSTYEGLHRWTAATGQLVSLNAPNGVQPVVVAPRVPPRQFPSARVPTRATGNLLGLNAHGQTVRLYTTSGLLGETSTASDGSFYVQVPADKPLRIEVRDAAGKTIRAEHGWFWMRPSEQRVCVGCHAGPERAPENRVPEVLMKSVQPVKMLEVLP